MRVTLIIENHEDAVAAQKMLTAYLGKEWEEERYEEKPKAKRSPRTTKSVEKTEPVEKEEPVEKSEVESDIDIKELTAIAKAAVANTDRATVKDIISEYGAKLSVVDEADYDKLAEKLKAL